MKKLLVCVVAAVLFACFSALPLAGQDRGLRVLAAETLGDDAVVGKQWAVFIAINRYTEWGPLTNPVKDAEEIRDILKGQYFIDEVLELYDQNATAGGIRRLFGELRQKTGINDSVFVFYAGHGQTDSITNSGSWIPVDAGRDQLSQTNWLPNIQVRNMLAALPAKHVFLISDACFSGDILDTSRGAAPQIDSEYYRRAYSRVSRQVMTSGASETVPDSSEFALRLKSSLRRAEGDYIDPEYLFSGVRELRSTQPMLGVITGSEHQTGGSFLFFRRPGDNTATAATAATDAVAARPGNLPETGSARPGTTGRAPARFSLDGVSRWGIGASYAAPLGFDARYTFFERFKTRGDFFILPNAYFVSAGYYAGNEFATDEWRAETFSFGLGGFWQLRFGEAQRFLFRFGPSFAWDMGTVKYTGSGSLQGDVVKASGPAFEFLTGLAFRLHPNWALAVDGVFHAGKTLHLTANAGVVFNVPYKR